MISDVYSLTREEIRHRLGKLNVSNQETWQVLEGKLHKTFSFRSFKAAMAFMQAVAGIADEMDHHPEWCNSYNRVSVDLITHSTGGISRLDFDLAHHMNEEHDRLNIS